MMRHLLLFLIPVLVLTAPGMAGQCIRSLLCFIQLPTRPYLILMVVVAWRLT